VSVEDIVSHGLPALRLSAARGASATVSLQGGQLLSWIPADSVERLYLSPRAVFDGRTPIRGGVPVCFPQFAGLGELPKHGFLRTANWTVATRRSADDYALVTLATSDSDVTRSLWPHRFGIELTVMLEGDRLDLELLVSNPGPTPFTFTAALHTYLKVTDIQRCTLEGLLGLDYRDAAAGDRIETERQRVLAIEAETDRVYRRAAQPLYLRDPSGRLAIGQQGFTDVVVWNPGPDKAATLADLPAGGWREFLCVEAAAADSPVILAPGDEWAGRQALAIA
jgi:glucose-6-phosphate 1-epimerase